MNKVRFLKGQCVLWLQNQEMNQCAYSMNGSVPLCLKDFCFGSRGGGGGGLGFKSPSPHESHWVFIDLGLGFSAAMQGLKDESWRLSQLALEM